MTQHRMNLATLVSSGSGRAACPRLNSQLAQGWRLLSLEAGASRPSSLHFDIIEFTDFMTQHRMNLKAEPWLAWFPQGL